jgi:hypothetical protein
MLQKVFITKYALTTGIFECVMDVRTETKSCYGRPDGYYFNVMFCGNDFHLTKEEALLDCEKRRLKKIKSLKKQIEKLEKLSFN